jgi:hypothetical protein
MVIAEVLLNIFLMLWVGFSLGKGWAIFYLVIYVYISIHALSVISDFNERLSEELHKIRDLLSLGITAALSYWIEQTINSGASLLRFSADIQKSEAENLNSACKGFNENTLCDMASGSETAAGNLSSASKSLLNYNDVFWGLNSLQLAVVVFIVGRLSYLIFGVVSETLKNK